MGQQQMILIALGVLLVAGAVTAGLGLFGDKQEQAAYDAVTAESMNVFARTIAWKQRPGAMGGGMTVQYLKGLTFSDIGFTATNGAGTKANDAIFKRTLRGLNSKRPSVRIQHAQTTNIRIDLFMYGVGSNCVKLRRARKVDGVWINASMNVGKNNPPEGCTTW